VVKAPRPVRYPKLVQLRLDEDLAAAIDDWRRVSRDIPNRSEAVRRLVRVALAAESIRRSPRTSDAG
jgi:metal-responsive CopG/Arc/MetJ family transcriptional regulator